MELHEAGEGGACRSQLQLLKPQEIEALHQATLRILGEIGFVLKEGTAREILTGAGARSRCAGC